MWHLKSVRREHRKNKGLRCFATTKRVQRRGAEKEIKNMGGRGGRFGYEWGGARELWEKERKSLWAKNEETSGVSL